MKPQKSMTKRKMDELCWGEKKQQNHANMLRDETKNHNSRFEARLKNKSTHNFDGCISYLKKKYKLYKIF